MDADPSAQGVKIARRMTAERDALATELAEIYPPFAEKIGELLPRLVASDRQLQHINDHARPSGAPALLVAELVARGLPSFAPRPYTDVPHIVSELRLPTFKYPDSERYVWPRGYRLA